MTAPVRPLAERAKNVQSADDAFAQFVEYVSDKGLTLYPAQEAAILEVMSGKNVILNTPTGSGKSLVATAMMFKTLTENRRCFYTSPIKALASEKFFALCQDFGPQNVGMMTGDAAINRDAPIICCTAEILSNLALREGESAALHAVIMDEFHYYGDRDRGVAWQVPILLLPQARFLLMSATLGNPEIFAERLTALTGTPSEVIKSSERPVPLTFQYRETPLHETVDELIKSNRHPVYMVNFTQRACAEEAQNLMSVNFSSREEKQVIHEALKDVRFDSPYGKEVQKFVRHGLGLHHAGLLPKYRLLVEKLAQQGLLKVVCGTDTLGVGVNIPIRTVLFTKLCKFDGEKTTILSVRDFKQISGRAGRKGFDEEGWVVAQAPEHVIENLRIEAKKASDPQKYKKLVKQKPPDKGYVHWDRATFDKLVERAPEELPSRFRVSHAMLISLMQNPTPIRGGGYRRMVDLISKSHTEAPQKRHLRRQSAILFKSLVRAGILKLNPVPMARGQFVELAPGLQQDFSLHQALSLFLLDMLPRLDPQAETHALDMLSLVESILENPDVILMKQLDALKKEKLAELKAQGVEFEKRIEELDKMEHPKPLRDFIYGHFNEYAVVHPWVGEENIRPKSVAREMFEKNATFHEYIRDYDLQRSEGLLLRYLSDVYKTLVQTVPEDFKTDALHEIMAFLRVMLGQVDASLIKEWEGLTEQAPSVARSPVRVVDLAQDPRRLFARIRAEVNSVVKSLAEKDFESASLRLAHGPEDGWNADGVNRAMAPYFQEHEILRADHAARAPGMTLIQPQADRVWTVKQTLLDPEGHGDWMLEMEVDLREKGSTEGPLLRLIRVGH